MPNCIQLIKKNQTLPTPLSKVDEEICLYLNIPEDPSAWAYNWLSMIGLECSLENQALGTEALREKVESWEIPELVQILDYLEENYTSRCWKEG